MQQKLFQFFFLSKEVGASENNREGTAKATNKIEILTEHIYSACNLMQVVVFCKHALICRTATQNFSL